MLLIGISCVFFTNCWQLYNIYSREDTNSGRCVDAAGRLEHALIVGNCITLTAVEDTNSGRCVDAAGGLEHALIVGNCITLTAVEDTNS